MNAPTATIELKPRRERPVLNRHPWIFSGAIRRVHGDPAPGDLVEVTAHDGAWLATAYFNSHSQIRARILSWERQEAIDAPFWRGRLERATAMRADLELTRQTDAYRLVFAEADGVPGLIVDRYGDYLVVQFLTAGIDRRRRLVVELLAEMVEPAGIIERSDVDVREKEGLAPAEGLLYGAAPPDDLVIHEYGVRTRVDLAGGQKTGHYLDQRENRLLVAQQADGKSVLNAFSYTGGFGLHAAAAGARQVVNLDSAADALAQIPDNLALNDLERPHDEYIQGDAFQLLRDLCDQGRRFDVVILDPPKMAHSRGEVERATRGYKDLNMSALHLLRPGGLLATFSCSGLVNADLFQKVVFGAAVDAGRNAQIIHFLSQGPDHPVLLTFPEAHYLKGLLCRVW